jgi:hypothetical protein
VKYSKQNRDCLTKKQSWGIIQAKEAGDEVSYAVQDC